MNETVKERLIKFLAYEGIAKTKFSESIGVDRTYVNSMSNSIQPDKLLKISQLYPQLDIQWLMVGKGEMIRKEHTIEETRPLLLLRPSFVGFHCRRLGHTNGHHRTGTWSRNTIHNYGHLCEPKA